MALQMQYTLSGMLSFGARRIELYVLYLASACTGERALSACAPSHRGAISWRWRRGWRYFSAHPTRRPSRLSESGPCTWYVCPLLILPWNVHSYRVSCLCILTVAEFRFLLLFLCALLGVRRRSRDAGLRPGAHFGWVAIGPGGFGRAFRRSARGNKPLSLGSYMGSEDYELTLFFSFMCLLFIPLPPHPIPAPISNVLYLV